MAKIVPNCLAFGKRNRFGNVTSALRLFELASMLVRPVTAMNAMQCNASARRANPLVRVLLVDLLNTGV